MTKVYLLIKKKIERSRGILPELSMGLTGMAASGSLISTTTQSDIKNVFATDEACSKQHLTTWNRKKHFSHSGNFQVHLDIYLHQISFNLSQTFKLVSCISSTLKSMFINSDFRSTVLEKLATIIRLTFE